MTTVVKRRLERLEAARPIGRTVCRHWFGVVIGGDSGQLNRPESCPSCGQFVPIYRVIVIHGIGPGDAGSQLAKSVSRCWKHLAASDNSPRAAQALTLMGIFIDRLISAARSPTMGADYSRNGE